MKWLGIDMGGTFTDLVLSLDGRTLSIHKVLTDRHHLLSSIAAGIAEILREGPESSGSEDEWRVIHGTTIATNTLLEQTGCRVGLITTSGFRDVLEIGRMKRYDHFNLFVRKHPALVPRYLRLEIEEEVSPTGQVIKPIDPAALGEAAELFRREDVEAVAISFINSYANSANEETAREELIRRLPGIPVCVSSEVSPEYGEFERTLGTVINTYLMPRFRQYLTELSDSLDDLGFSARPEIVASNGGLLTADVAALFPIRLIMSGPAAGVNAAAQVGMSVGCPNVVSLDMGGTSTDVAVVRGGKPTYVAERPVGPWPVKSVTTDVHSIGAGGGSIIWLDAMGSVHIGPRSAGADPGPACYGLGGTEPTLTDANLVLGYLQPDPSSQWGLTLNAEAAHRALAERIARPRGLVVAETAAGVVELAITDLVGAVRRVTSERGLDPRDFVLVPFGGAGPTHAAAVARALQIKQVVVPPNPSVFSAYGMVVSAPRVDGWVTFPASLARITPQQLTEAFEAISIQSTRMLPEPGEGGYRVHRTAELCYQGQRMALAVEVDDKDLQQGDLRWLAASFDERFTSRFGFRPDGDVQIVNLRVTVTVPRETPTIRRVTSEQAGHMVEQRMWVAEAQEFKDCPVYQRVDLPPEQSLRGPCLISDDYSSIVIGTGQACRLDEFGNIVVDTGA